MSEIRKTESVMDSGGGRLESIDFGGVCPFAHLFRAFRIALDVRCLILGTVGWLLVAAGNEAAELLPFAGDTTRFADQTAWPWQVAAGIAGEGGPIDSWDAPAGSVWNRVVRLTATVLWPLASVVGPAAVLFEIDTTWSDVAMA